MNGISLEKHYTLSSSHNIKELFNSILHSIGITYFNYIKIYNEDCSRELLTNNPEWIDHFYKNALFNSIGAIDIEHLLPKGYWSMLRDLPQIIALLWLGVVGSGFCLYLYCSLIQNAGAVFASMITYLMTITGVIMGVIFLHETISHQVMIGCIFIFFSLILVNHEPLFEKLFVSISKQISLKNAHKY